MQINKPTLIIDESIARRNIRNMAQKANRNNVEFIPHFKTHQSKEVGEWFRQEGISKITVSSVSMAKYFAENGWNDITIAFPVNLLEIEDINELASRVELTLLLVNIEVIQKFKTFKNKVSFYVEIDAGYHRSGVNYNNFSYIHEVITEINNSHHHFKGFYCHAGNSYSARKSTDVRIMYSEVQTRLQQLATEFELFNPKIAIGDTPTCSIIETFEGISSLHPGNFVYYDLTQVEIGSCNIEDIAVVVKCPVVMKSKERNELVIYGGGVHFSKEQLEIDGRTTYGLVSKQDNGGMDMLVHETYVKSISQEHGIISTTREFLNSVKVGEVLTIFPVHSCMTVDCMHQAFTSDGKVIFIMPK